MAPLRRFVIGRRNVQRCGRMMFMCFLAALVCAVSFPVSQLLRSGLGVMSSGGLQSSPARKGNGSVKVPMLLREPALVGGSNNSSAVYKAIVRGGCADDTCSEYQTLSSAVVQVVPSPQDKEVRDLSFVVHATVSFTPAVAGLHLIEVRPEYTSRAAALTDFGLSHSTPGSSVPFIGHFASSPQRTSVVVAADAVTAVGSLGDRKGCAGSVSPGVWVSSSSSPAAFNPIVNVPSPSPSPLPPAVLLPLVCENRTFYGFDHKLPANRIAAKRSGEAGRAWRQWSPQRQCLMQRLDAADARACLRARPVVLIGDSLSQQIASYLKCALGAGPTGVKDLVNNIPFTSTSTSGGHVQSDDLLLLRQITIKGTLPDSLPMVEAALREAAAQARAWRQEGRSRFLDGIVDVDVHPILVINIAGLWQAAYGKIDSWASMLPDILRRMKMTAVGQEPGSLSGGNRPEGFGVFEEDAFGRLPGSVFWASTTDVHPILLAEKVNVVDSADGTTSSDGDGGIDGGVDGGMKEKWAKKAWFTSPRVEALNTAAKRAIERSNMRAANDGSGYIGLLDFFAPTHAVDEKDPLAVQDMRHFGPATIRELATIMLDATCLGAPLSSSSK